MENTESGDELGTSFLHSDPQAFLVQEDMDGMYNLLSIYMFFLMVVSVLVYINF